MLVGEANSNFLESFFRVLVNQFTLVEVLNSTSWLPKTNNLYTNPNIFIYKSYFFISKPYLLYPTATLLYPNPTFLYPNLLFCIQPYLLYPNPTFSYPSLVFGLEGTVWGQGRERFGDGGNGLRAGEGKGWRPGEGTVWGMGDGITEFDTNAGKIKKIKHQLIAPEKLNQNLRDFKI